jgi:hypothetical protein
MIEQILQMLQIAEFVGESEAIDIAKGKHKIQTTFKDIKKQIKRAKSWQ